MEGNEFIVTPGKIRCDCKWSGEGGACYKTQLKLHQFDPDGKFTGHVKIDLPAKLTEKLANKEALTRPESKKYFLLKRISRTCGVAMQDLLKKKSVFVSKHHWRASAHDYVAGKNKKNAKTTSIHVTSFFSDFSSKADWENVTGVYDEADIFDKKAFVVVLSPNNTEEEWPSLYKHLENPNDERDARVLERESIRVESRHVSHWMSDITSRDKKITTLKAQNSKQKKEIQSLKNHNNNLNNTITTMKNEKSDIIQATYALKRQLASSEAVRQSVQEKLHTAQSNHNLSLLLNLRRMQVASNTFSRLTMFDDEYHQRNEDTCQDIFGFRSWKELKVFVQTTMPEVKIKLSHPVSYDAKCNVVHFQQYTDFEQLMITKMFFHTGWKRKKLGLIINQLDRRQVGAFIAKWGPRWGKVGQYLSMLDVDANYLQKERPIAYEKEGMLFTALLLDGKDYLTDTLRTDKTYARNQNSNKSNGAAAREMCCTTPSGLCFLYTRLVGGRCEENDLVKVLGGDGKDFVPLEQFKAIAQSGQEAELNYRTAIDEYKDQRKTITIPEEDSSDSESENGDEDDTSGSSSGNESRSESGESSDKEGDSDEDNNSASESENGDDGNENDSHATNDSETVFDNGVKDDWSEPTIELAIERMDAELEEFEKTDGGKIRTAESLENEAKKMIREQSPSCIPIEKLAQYEMLERLYIQFEEEKSLSKCSLSFYIKATTKFRRKFLYYMGSSMADESWNDPSVTLPDEIPVGLTMIPRRWRALADKGFTYVTRHFPNFNPIDTPARMGKRKYGRHSEEEVKKSKKKCKLRYTCEVFFARVTEEEVLKDRISYHNFSILPHVQAWSHAAGNLREPLAKPLRGMSYFPKNTSAKRKRKKKRVE